MDKQKNLQEMYTTEMVDYWIGHLSMLKSDSGQVFSPTL